MSKNTQAVNVKWYPRLFTDDMVRELLADRKTATRWPLRKQPEGIVQKVEEWTWEDAGNTYRAPVCPGDIIWARETWAQEDVACPPVYRADGNDMLGNKWASEALFKIRWSPNIHMPRKFTRIFLRVTDVRLVHVQDISEPEAQAEGVHPAFSHPGLDGVSSQPSYRWGFWSLWDELYAARGLGWDASPWVWAASFRRISKAEAEA